MSITNSSLALLDDPADGAQGLLVGQPRPIRSDEWIRFTPETIGNLAEPRANLESLLAEPDTPRTGPMAVLWAAVHPEGVVATGIARISLPMAFAFDWWFPILLFFVCVPLVLRRLGSTLVGGIAAAVVIYFSPPNQWWSLHPTYLLGWTSLAALCALVAAERRTGRWPVAGTVALTAIAALAIARLGTSYVIWVVLLVPLLLGPTLAWFAGHRDVRRRGLTVSGVAGVVGVLAAAILQFGDRERMDVLTSTVYPAGRRLVGEPLDLGILLGGPFNGYLQDAAVVPAAYNTSEVAGGWLILLAAVVALPLVWSQRAPVRGAVLATMAVWTFACYTWITFSWPPQAAGFRLFSIIPTLRMNQVAWIGVVLLLALVAHRARDSAPAFPWSWRASMAGVLVLVLGLAGSLLREDLLPTMPLSRVWILAIAWTVAIVWFVAARRELLAWLPIIGLAVATTIGVNPLQHGLADLRTSAGAVALRSLEDAAQGTDAPFLAADDYWTSALMAANGVETLSGQQVVGPQRSSWDVLDPDGTFTDEWNRGASTVLFNWLGPGQPTIIDAIQDDVVIVRIDPCSPELGQLGLGGISSGRELPASACLTAFGEISAAGRPKWLYKIGEPEPAAAASVSE